MLLDNFINEKEEEKKINENNFNIIKIHKNNIHLKLLKLRTLFFKETENIINYNFFINHNGYTKNKNNIVYIPNIVLKNFLFNITPLGLKKITKQNVLGIEELQKRKKELINEKEKQENKKNPSIEVSLDGPGVR